MRYLKLCNKVLCLVLAFIFIVTISLALIMTYPFDNSFAEVSKSELSNVEKIVC